MLRHAVSISRASYVAPERPVFVTATANGPLAKGAAVGAGGGIGAEVTACFGTGEDVFAAGVDAHPVRKPIAATVATATTRRCTSMALSPLTMPRRRSFMAQERAPVAAGYGTETSCRLSAGVAARLPASGQCHVKR